MNRTMLSYICIFSIFYCNAVSSKNLVKVTIFSATSSCAHWNEDRQKSQGAPLSSGDWISRSIDVAWLAGYLSGVNLTSQSGENLFRDIDMSLATDWVDKYCLANRTSDVPDAIGNLLKRLKRTP